MVNVVKLANGDLKVTANNEDRAMIAQHIKERNRWIIWADLLEPFACNGSYSAFDASDGNPFVGLTSAPCIAECIDTNDNGTQTIEGDFWYFGDYMIEDELESLKNRGYVVFTLAR
jgi:hypothetical protein